MRILIINPNTTASMTAKIDQSARLVASPGTELKTINPAQGPASIEGFYDEAMVIPEVLKEVEKSNAEGYDGFIIACFDDPGVMAARTLTDKPVIGIAEAAIRMATLAAMHMTIITTLQRSVAATKELTHRYNVADHCNVRWVDASVLDFEKPGSQSAALLRDEIKAAIREDNAEAILLGCAGMADLSNTLTEEFGIPVIDGVAAGVKLAEAAIGLGLKTSKVGGYAPPLDKDEIEE